MFCSILDVDPASLAGEELTAHLRDLEAMQVQLDAARLAALVEWDRQRAWANDGSASAGARLARETGIAGSTARERVRVAGKLPGMPLARASFDGGRLGWSKLRMLAAVINERTLDAFERDEQMLVERAEQLTVDQLTVFLRHWCRLVDEDGANASADAMHDGQYVQFAESWQGEGFLRGRLDPEARAIVKTELDAIADELYRAERKTAMATGDAPASPQSSSRRAVDALVEMARRSRANTDAAASGAYVTPARPLVMVNIDVDQYANMTARLADGTPLTERDALRLSCDAAIVRVLSKGASVPVDLGRATREPNRAQRRAMSALWPCCAFPGCDRPYAWCELHHIIHWTRGGPTDLEWLLPLCSSHHHTHHKGIFDIRRVDGTIEFTRPDGQLIGPATPTIAQLLAPLHNIGPAA